MWYWRERQQKKAENNPGWVKAAMHRLESSFDSGTVKQIRRNCQCGYGMEEKLALVKELKAEASSIDEFAASGKARAAGLFCKDGELFLQFVFCPCPMLAELDAEPDIDTMLQKRYEKFRRVGVFRTINQESNEGV